MQSESQQALEEEGRRGELITHDAPVVRTMIVVPVLQTGREANSGNGAVGSSVRSGQSRLNEACGLARAIDLDIVASTMFSINAPRPATFLTLGKVEHIGAQIAQADIELVMVDHPLTPVQQRNLEKIWKVKVIDRTGLILEIFGARARTREGVLQVELAHLNYQKGRLVRSWTHLERQRGGTGFLGGPGETQIEADRRVLQGKINKLQRELERIVKTRSLHRVKRQKTPHPVVALVGYTNAGKSTLFNALTGAGVDARDMLFATLDPTLRRLELPSGATILLSDTVGFISDLPHHLVAAFRATLEEVIEANLILHVRDIHDPDSQAQAQDVMNILGTLGVKTEGSKRIIEVWNKADLLESHEKNQLLNLLSQRDVPAHLVSATKGEGLRELIGDIEHHVMGQWRKRYVRLKSHEMALLAWIYRHAKMGAKNEKSLHRRDFDHGEVEIEFMLSDEDWGRFMALRAKANKS